MPAFSLKLSKKQFVVAAVATGVIAATAGGALAYWTDSGSGSSTATTGTSTPFTVAVTANSGNAALTPGGATDGYTFTVTNAGSGKQRVSSATVTVANSDGSAWTSVSGCSASDYSITGATVTAATLNAGGSTSGSFSVQMTDTGSNQDACKGATVPLYVSVS